MGAEEFKDAMVEEFNKFTQGRISLDEMLLRPKYASEFCDFVRRPHGWFDLPDDLILRSIMMRRKNTRPPAE